jgi:hypothetical protein
MSATMHPDGRDPRAARRSGYDHLAFLLVAIITLTMGMGAAMLDAGLAAQVSATVLLLVGCAALSVFIVLRKAERP